jgi:hypothetical protein
LSVGCCPVLLLLQVLLQLQEELLALPPESLTDRQRALIAEALAASDKHLVDGSDEFLQLLNVAAKVQGIMAG